MGRVLNDEAERGNGGGITLFHAFPVALTCPYVQADGAEGEYGRFAFCITERSFPLWFLGPILSVAVSIPHQPVPVSPVLLYSSSKQCSDLSVCLSCRPYNMLLGILLCSFCCFCFPSVPIGCRPIGTFMPKVPRIRRLWPPSLSKKRLFFLFFICFCCLSFYLFYPVLVFHVCLLIRLFLLWAHPELSQRLPGRSRISVFDNSVLCLS